MAKDKETKTHDFVDESSVAISTHNVVVNKRPTTEKDMKRFLKRRAAVLEALEKEKE
jgi:hypothetical protein